MVPGLEMMMSRSVRLGATVDVPSDPDVTTSAMRNDTRLYIHHTRNLHLAAVGPMVS